MDKRERNRNWTDLLGLDAEQDFHEAVNALLQILDHGVRQGSGRWHAQQVPEIRQGLLRPVELRMVVRHPLLQGQLAI